MQTPTTTTRRSARQDRHFYYAKYDDMQPEIKAYMRLKLTPLVYIHHHVVRHMLCRSLFRWRCHTNVCVMEGHESNLTARLRTIAIYLVHVKRATTMAMVLNLWARQLLRRRLAAKFSRWKQHVINYNHIVAHAPAFVEWMLPRDDDDDAVAVKMQVLQLQTRGLVQCWVKHMGLIVARRFRKWRLATHGYLHLGRCLVRLREQVQFHLWRTWTASKRTDRTRGQVITAERQATQLRQSIQQWRRYRLHAHIQHVVAHVSIKCHARAEYYHILCLLKANVLRQRKRRLVMHRFRNVCENYSRLQVTAAWAAWKYTTWAKQSTEAILRPVIRRMQSTSLRRGFNSWRSHCVATAHNVHFERKLSAAVISFGAQATIRLWRHAINRRLRHAFHRLREFKRMSKQDVAHASQILLVKIWAGWRGLLRQATLVRRTSVHLGKTWQLKQLQSILHAWLRLQVDVRAIKRATWTDWLHFVNIQHDLHRRVRREWNVNQLQMYLKAWRGFMDERRRMQLAHLGMPCGDIQLDRPSYRVLVAQICFSKWKRQLEVHGQQTRFDLVLDHLSQHHRRRASFNEWKHYTLTNRKHALVNRDQTMQKIMSVLTTKIQRQSDKHLCRATFTAWTRETTKSRQVTQFLRRLVAILDRGAISRSYRHWQLWSARYSTSLSMYNVALLTIQKIAFKKWAHKIKLRQELRRVTSRWVHKCTTQHLKQILHAWRNHAGNRGRRKRNSVQLQDSRRRSILLQTWQSWRTHAINAVTSQQNALSLLGNMWTLWQVSMRECASNRNLLRRLVRGKYRWHLRRAFHGWTKYLLFQVTSATTRVLHLRLTERDQDVRELLQDQAMRRREMEQFLMEKEKMMHLLDESRQKLHLMKRLQQEIQELRRVNQNSSRHEHMVEQLKGITFDVKKVLKSNGQGRCVLNERMLNQVEAENERLKQENERQEVTTHLRLSELTMQLAEARELCVRLKDLERYFLLRTRTYASSRYNQQLEEQLYDQADARKSHPRDLPRQSDEPFEP
ncbi:Aste57867_13559 [Aphanomyces stellatus]|uniref:Aste57867_13559 protein n=1 Tax=Aphanomyces stellatus TaxID=120398 RepID=A0A485KYS8_9STRA|nr:hypothetical protein As57867_013509 [Aphanomyces stellatus]VFT90397.1 Aste57867_13559 [Aphanomyces stellatus]